MLHRTTLPFETRQQEAPFIETILVLQQGLENGRRRRLRCCQTEDPLTGSRCRALTFPSFDASML